MALTRSNAGDVLQSRTRDAQHTRHADVMTISIYRAREQRTIGALLRPLDIALAASASLASSCLFGAIVADATGPRSSTNGLHITQFSDSLITKLPTESGVGASPTVPAVRYRHTHHLHYQEWT